MPRPTDPGTLAPGSGLAANESIEANSLIHPTASNEGLRAHIADPSKAHEARAVHVEDTAGLFVSDQVEGCLAELAGGTSAFSTNGLVSGGTYVYANPVLTLNATVVLLNGNAVDYTGQTVSLTPTATNYVYINKNTGVLTAGLVAPTVGAEHILIAVIQTDAFGAIVSERDARYFIPNNDRKLPFTVRNDGTDINNNSEGCFETIDAAMLWLSLYGGSGSQRFKIVVRGAQVVPATILLPLDEITIEGEGNASLVTGAALGSFIDLNGKNGIHIRHLSLVADHAGVTAIYDVLGVRGIRVEDCRIVSGGADWNNGIELGAIAAASQDVVIEKCEIEAETRGISIWRPRRVRVLNNWVNCTAGTAGVYGIIVGDSSVYVLSEGRSFVRGNTTNGFGIGVMVHGIGMSVVDNRIEDSITGIYAEGSAQMVSNNLVLLDSTDGMDGIQLLGNSSNIQNNQIIATRSSASYGGARPHGVWLKAPSDRATLTGNLITGFASDSSDGTGIRCETGSDNMTITGGLMDGVSVAVDVEANSTNARITGVDMVNVISLGMRLFGNYPGVSNCRMEVDGDLGIRIEGTDARVTGCDVICEKSSWSTEFPYGIRLENNALRATISDCRIFGWLNTGTNDGAGIRVADGMTQASIQGCHIKTAEYGVWVRPGADGVGVHSCRIEEVAEGIRVQASNASIQGNGIVLDASRGIYGIRMEDAGSHQVVNDNQIGCLSAGDHGIYFDQTTTSLAQDIKVQGNSVLNPVDVGIRFRGFFRDVAISGNIVDGGLPADWSNPTSPAGISIQAGYAMLAISITGNTVYRCKNGILAQATRLIPIETVTISNNTIHHCAFSQTGVSVDTFDGAGCKGIGVEFVTGLTINGNTIRRIGQSVNELGVPSFPTAGGPDVNSGAVYLRNCSRLNVGGNSIEDIVSDGLGKGYGIVVTQRTAGLTLGTFTTRGFSINDNRIMWADSLPGNGFGESGIVVTCTFGGDTPGVYYEMYDIRVANNSVRQTNGAGISVSAGDRSTLTAVAIEGNSATLTGGSGVLVLLYEPSTFVGDSKIQNGTISGNVVDQPGNHGIELQGNNTAALISRFEGWDVSNNTIRNTSGNGIEVLCDGNILASHVSIEGNIIRLVAFGILAQTTVVAASLTHLSVLNNTIDSCSRGIYIYNSTGTFPAAFGGFTVSGNRITDPTLHGIYVRSYEFLVGVAVSDNTVTDTTGGGAVGTFCEIECLDGTASYSLLQRVTVANNTHHGDGSHMGLMLQSEGVARDVVVEGNNLTLEAGVQRTFHLNLQPGTSAGELLAYDITVNGNTFVGGYGVYVNHYNDVKLSNFIFTNNTIRSSGSHGFYSESFSITAGLAAAAYSWEISGNLFVANAETGMRVRFGQGTSPIDMVYDIAIRDNHFSLNNNANNDSGRALFVQTTCNLINLSITDNFFELNGNINDAEGTGCVDVQLGMDTGAFASRNIRICRNQINNLQGSYGIYVYRNSNAPESCVTGLDVCDNQILGLWCYDGIRVDLTGFGDDGASVQTGQVSINGNTVQRISSLLSDGGIALIGPLNGTLLNLEVCKNKVNGTGNGDSTFTYGAINLIFRDPVFSLAVDDNEVSASAGQGIHYQNSAGVDGATFCRNKFTNLPATNRILSIDCQGDSTNIRADGNSFTDCGSTTSPGTEYEANLLVQMGGGDTGCRNLSVNGNQFADNLGHAIVLTLRSGSTSSDWFSVTVANNLIQNQSASGIFCNFSKCLNGARDISIMGNQLAEIGTTGADNYAIRVNTPDDCRIENLNISHNQVHITGAYYTFGYYVYLQNTLYNVRINDNTYDGRDATLRSAFMFESTTGDNTAQFLDLHICNNSMLNTGGTAGYGFLVRLRRPVRSFIFTGNISYLNYRGVYMDWGTGVGTFGTGKGIHVFHNIARNNSNLDCGITGDAIPNAGSAEPGEGWSCAYNTAEDNQATGGWGATGVAGSFCRYWDQGENNEDGVA